MKATAMANLGNDEGEAPAPANSNGVKPAVKAKGKLKQTKKPPKAVNALAEPGSSKPGDYDKDPDKGERDYHDHEVHDMANHVVKAMGIIHHPYKSKAVQGHFDRQGMHAKNFEGLKAHISSEMNK